MSLIKQLWLAISVVMAVAFGGSLLVSVLSARHYLEQQLQVKNIDNATSLALSLSQLDKDPVTVELQIAAQFDAGHYRFIRVQSPSGEVLAERVFKGRLEGVPGWFVGLIPIHAEPGRAQILDGWKQYGTLTLASHDQYVYRSLWSGTVELFVWFLIGSIGVGLAGTIAVRTITRPLKEVVGQAEAIAARRFVSLPEPRTPEMRAMTRALNQMVGRLKAMFAEEAARLEALRRKVNYDAVTGLANREHFLSSLREQLGGEQHAVTGVLVMINIADLAELNAGLGHRRVDEALTDFGKVLNDLYLHREGRAAGRLRGSEFAVLCPGEESPGNAAREVHQRLAGDWLPSLVSSHPDLFHVGAVPYRHGETVGELMVRAEQALAIAKAKGPNEWHALEITMPRLSMPAEKWRSLFEEAIASQRFSLTSFAVRDGSGVGLLHHEAALRLRNDEGGSQITAGEFMPMAAHLGMTAPIDLVVVRLALEHLRHHEGDLAINLSTETITDFHFRNQLVQLLRGEAGLCGRLLFEVPEYGVFQQFDAFRDLARSIKMLGARVGIEYFGQHLVDSERLSTLGLDYVKVSPSFLAGLHSNTDNQELVEGICRLAHALGIQVIALGVESREELPLLVSLGVDGVTGPGVG